MRHPVLVIICVFAAMVLLFSCDNGNSTPETELTVSRVDITIAADTIGTGVKSLGMMNPDSTITITGLDPEKLYSVAFNGTQSAGTGRSVSSTLSDTGIGTFLINPDAGGTARFSPREVGYTSPLENVLIYELKEETFTLNEHEMYIDYHDAPLYWTNDGRKVFEAYYTINLSRPEDYGITDLSKVCIFDIRTRFKGGGQTSSRDRYKNSDEHLGSNSRIQNLSRHKDDMILYSVHSSVAPETDGGWGTCLRTPETLTLNSKEQALSSPQAYILPESTDPYIIEITIPEASTIGNDSTIEVKDGNGDGGFHARAYSIRPDDETEKTTLRIYIPEPIENQWFASYWWNPDENNKVVYETNGASITIRDVTAEDKKEFEIWDASTNNHFSIEDITPYMNSEKTMFTIPVYVIGDQVFDSLTVTQSGDAHVKNVSHSFSDNGGYGSDGADVSGNTTIHMKRENLRINFIKLMGDCTSNDGNITLKMND